MKMRSKDEVMKALATMIEAYKQHNDRYVTKTPEQFVYKHYYDFYDWLKGDKKQEVQNDG